MPDFFKYGIMEQETGKSLLKQKQKGERVMKKRMLAMILVMLTVLSLAGCGKFTCDLCSQEKSGKKHTETVMGQKVTICNDCYKQLEELGSALGL